MSAFNKMFEVFSAADPVIQLVVTAVCSILLVSLLCAVASE